MAVGNNYTLKEFQEILSHFGRAVKDGEYKPLHYEQYRILKKDSNNKRIFFLYHKEPYEEAYIRTCSGDAKLLWSGKRGDNSFADFLFKYYNYDEEEEKNKMKAKDNNEYNYTYNEDKYKYDSNITTSAYGYGYDYNTITTGEIAKKLADSPLTTCAPSSNATVVIQPIPITDLEKRVTKLEEQNERKNEMDTSKMVNFNFGPVDSNIRMSPYGMAIKNADGNYVSYDKSNGNIVNVEILNFEGDRFMYKVPVAVKDISAGDIVIHNRKPCFVVSTTDGEILVIDIFNGEKKVILPARSMFGFDFVTKVVSFVDFTSATADSPFGNMLPFMLMKDSNDMKPFLLMSMMNKNGNFDMVKNPMMMLLLMKDGEMDESMRDVMMMMMAYNQQMNQVITPPAAQ